jgi:dihydrofolate reductase
MKASVFCGTSLDGFIARENDGLDFLPDDPGEGHGYMEFYETVDVMIIGRRLYDVALSFGSWPYGKKPVFVLSSKELAPAPEGANIERLSGTPAEVLAQVEARGYRHAYVDGGITIQRFLNAGLIDTLIVTTVPVLIGKGIPLFGPLDHDVRLRHVSTKTLSSGCVQSEYAVIGGRP